MNNIWTICTGVLNANPWDLRWKSNYLNFKCQNEKASYNPWFIHNTFASGLIEQSVYNLQYSKFRLTGQELATSVSFSGANRNSSICSFTCALRFLRSASERTYCGNRSSDTISLIVSLQL